jgi:hypothetical protein
MTQTSPTCGAPERHCDREADPEKQEYGLEDGSAGLQGNIYYTDRYAELKAFGAAALTGVLQGFQTVQGTML